MRDLEFVSGTHRQTSKPKDQTMFAATNQIQTQAAAFLAAQASGIDLWVADAASAEWLMAHVNVLSAADRAEFATIQQPAARWQSMSARILLRVALSYAVDGEIAAIEWTFVKGANGKKAVAHGQPQVHFSVSHNETMAVVAVSRSAALGVDVETAGADVNEDVVADFLSASEQASLDNNDATIRASQFTRFWTLKEAFTKMTGEGLSADFASIEFDAEEDALTAGEEASFECFDIAGCQIALAIDAAAAEVTVRELA